MFLYISSDIKKLLSEVRDYQSKHGSQNNSPDSEEPSTSSGSNTPSSHGVITDRFNQGATIVVTGNSKGPGRGGFELRLPSMSLFTSKMSNQNLFLRMLKVVIQLREAARKAAKRATETQRQCECLFNRKLVLQYYSYSYFGGSATLLLVGTCLWEFEKGPIQIPIFQEKVTHSYTSRSDSGSNFDQNYLIFLKFS